MEFKKVLSGTLSAIVLGSGILLNSCYKPDIQKDTSKLSSYLLDKKDLQFESKFHKDEFEYILYYIPDKNPDNKKIRYVEVYKDKKLYGIINGEVYYLDKDQNNTIDLKCDTNKIKCYNLSNSSYDEEKAEEIPFPEGEK